METANLQNQNEVRNERLWKIAKRRAEFKKHLLTYIIVNTFLWSVWIITGVTRGHLGFIWPLFVTFGWGIGIVFNYIGAYTGFKDNLTEKEYQKLIGNN
jgi:hypothetical protein